MSMCHIDNTHTHTHTHTHIYKYADTQFVESRNKGSRFKSEWFGVTLYYLYINIRIM